MHGTCRSASTGASLCLPSQLTFDYFRIKERSDNGGNDRPVGKGVRRPAPRVQLLWTDGLNNNLKNKLSRHY